MEQDERLRVLVLTKDGPTAGAGKALFRIHCELNRRANVISNFLTLEAREDAGNRLFNLDNSLLNKIYRRGVNLFNRFFAKWVGQTGGYVYSHNLFPNMLINKSNDLIKQADVIFLGWVGFGYLKPSQLQLFKDKVILWRFSDMWAMTGGCHISYDCGKYLTECKNCPQLHPSIVDVAKFQFHSKRKIYKKIDFKVIAPSKWMFDKCNSSALLRGKEIHYIPTGVDLEIFKPMAREELRSKFNIDPNSIVLLFGASSVRETSKGFFKLMPVIEKIATDVGSTKIELLVFGGTPPGQLRNQRTKVTSLGRVEGDQRLAEVYNCADVFVAPYINDNLPNTVIEAIACGLPVVGFRSGGVPELIDHGVNGYLVQPNDLAGFEVGLKWAINNLSRVNFLESSVKKAKDYSLTRQIEQIEKLIFETYVTRSRLQKPHMRD